jgi:hypothetical protein
MAEKCWIMTAEINTAGHACRRNPYAGSRPREFFSLSSMDAIDQNVVALCVPGKPRLLVDANRSGNEVELQKCLANMHGEFDIA